MVNTTQQVGGSIGTAAAQHARRGHGHPLPGRARHVAFTAGACASFDSYRAAFLTSSGVFVAIAVLGFLLLRWGRLQPADGAH